MTTDGQLVLIEVSPIRPPGNVAAELGRPEQAAMETARRLARAFWWPMKFENHATLTEAIRSVANGLAHEGVCLPHEHIVDQVLDALGWAWARAAWAGEWYDSVPEVARKLIDGMRRLGCDLPDDRALELAVAGLASHRAGDGDAV